MKSIVLFLFFFEVTCSAFAQDTTIHVVNAGSGELSSKEVTLSYFIGEYIPGLEQITGINAVQNQLKEGIVIFPNPVDRTLYLKSSLTSFETYKVFDLKGNLKKEFPAIYTSVDISELPPGLYVLEALDKEKIIRGKVKFIKK